MYVVNMETRFCIEAEKTIKEIKHRKVIKYENIHRFRTVKKVGRDTAD